MLVVIADKDKRDCDREHGEMLTGNLKFENLQLFRKRLVVVALHCVDKKIIVINYVDKKIME